MLLTAENLSKIKYKTKRVKLQKAEAEIFVGLLPASMVKSAKDAKFDDGESKDAEQFGYEIIKTCVVDDKGEPVFTCNEDIDNLSPAIQAEIIEAVNNYNGLSEKAQKHLEKN